MNRLEKKEEAKEQIRIAYVLLWFPLASETFIFREVSSLVEKGWKIIVFTLYGENLKGCSTQMKNWNGPVFRMGLKSFFPIIFAFARTVKKRPAFVWQLMRLALFRKMRNLESLCENIWSFFAAFLLAEECQKQKIDFIHSAWANGPATAAWIASRLSNIPFAFTGRAGDIYPQDGLLREKCADASFIRTNNEANIKWLEEFCPANQKDKIKLVYNSIPFQEKKIERISTLSVPKRILAVGRFVRTKGFPDLLSALARLRRENFPVELTLIGDGAWQKKLVRQIRRQGLSDIVSLPGFLPNDLLIKYMYSHDLLVVPSVVYKNGDRDGIPNVIMEAFSMELPVVATDVCGISEVVQPHKTGYLVPQHSPSLLARAIRDALENQGKTNEMAKAGNRLVRDMFDSGKNTQILADIYAGAGVVGKNLNEHECADFCRT